MEMLTRMRVFFLALLVLTLASVLVTPLISEMSESSGSVQEISVYVVLLLAWVLLGVTFSVVYFVSERGRRLRPTPLHRWTR